MSEAFTKSGTSIPFVGLGTWDMQGSTCSIIVQEALEMGYRHIDGASMYENESEVGKGVSDSGVDREEIFITTKINTTSWTPSNLMDGPSNIADASTRSSFLDERYLANTASPIRVRGAPSSSATAAVHLPVPFSPAVSRILSIK
jgi:aryl-alcohol dehydrogenase-like predicted oxidoreductase